MTIGERIKYLRKKTAMTQSDIAKKLNIATQTVFKYEKDIVTSIPMENIEKLAQLFDVTPAYIMGWETETDGESTAPPKNNEPLASEKPASFVMPEDRQTAFCVCEGEKPRFIYHSNPNSIVAPPPLKKQLMDECAYLSEEGVAAVLEFSRYLISTGKYKP